LVKNAEGENDQLDSNLKATTKMSDTLESYLPIPDSTFRSMRQALHNKGVDVGMTKGVPESEVVNYLSKVPASKVSPSKESLQQLADKMVVVSTPGDPSTATPLTYDSDYVVTGTTVIL